MCRLLLSKTYFQTLCYFVIRVYTFYKQFIWGGQFPKERKGFRYQLESVFLLNGIDRPVLCGSLASFL